MGRWRLGEMPLTLFIVIAAALTYLFLASRPRKPLQVVQGGQEGASGRPKVSIPPGTGLPRGTEENPIYGRTRGGAAREYPIDPALVAPPRAPYPRGYRP